MELKIIFSQEFFRKNIKTLKKGRKISHEKRQTKARFTPPFVLCNEKKKKKKKTKKKKTNEREEKRTFRDGTEG